MAVVAGLSLVTLKICHLWLLSLATRKIDHLRLEPLFDPNKETGGIWLVCQLSIPTSDGSVNIQDTLEIQTISLQLCATSQARQKYPKITGWWYTYPSEKYESHLGWWHSQYMESHKSHVPNHQPGIVALNIMDCHFVGLPGNLWWSLDTPANFGVGVPPASGLPSNAKQKTGGLVSKGDGRYRDIIMLVGRSNTLW